MASFHFTVFGGTFLLLVVVNGVQSQCDLTKTLDQPKDRTDLLKLLNNIPAEVRNRNFSDADHKYKYSFRICPDKATNGDESIGVDQNLLVPNREGQQHVAVIGRFNESDMHFSKRGDLIILTYTRGTNYSSACNKGERHAVVILRCVPDITDYNFEMLMESAGVEEDFCFYTFELLIPAGKLPSLFPKCGAADSPDPANRLDPVAPPADGAHRGLGAGSIILILLLVSMLAFFAIGSVYKRFVVGAQGWEQVPFIDFWRRCGSVNGWRSTFGRGRSGRMNAYDEYSPVSTDEERQPALDRNGNIHDDHLLPM